MKTHQLKNSIFVLFSLLTLGLGACKKKENVEPITTIQPDSFPSPISAIVSQSMVDSLRALGCNVYDGTVPPIVNGIYFMTPDSCTFDNSPGNFTGTLFSDYKFRFSNQDNTQFTLMVEQKAIPSGMLSPTPSYSYISGSGSNFSIFILRTLSPTGIEVQQFNILTGTLTANGIQNFKNTLYIRSKGSDPGNSLPPAGTIRVFVNGGNGLAAITSTF